MIELHSLLKSYTIHNWLSNIWRYNSFIIICFSEHSLRFVLFVLLWLSDKDCCSHCMMNCVSNLCSFWSRSKRREERPVQQSRANTWPNSLQQKIELFLISQRIWNNVINGFWSQHKKQIISFLSFISEKTPDTPASLKLCIVWRHPSLWCHVSVSPFTLNQRKLIYWVYQSTTCWDTIFMRIQSWWRGGETYVWEDSKSESKSKQTVTRMKWPATISSCSSQCSR